MPHLQPWNSLQKNCKSLLWRPKRTNYPIQIKQPPREWPGCALNFLAARSLFLLPAFISPIARRFAQAKADLQRSNSARDLLEQAVEEMKRELIAASAACVERSALQSEVRVNMPPPPPPPPPPPVCDLVFCLKCLHFMLSSL